MHVRLIQNQVICDPLSLGSPNWLLEPRPHIQHMQWSQINHPELIFVQEGQSIYSIQI